MEKILTILDGKIIAQKISEDIKIGLEKELKKPRLDIFLIGDNPSSIKYVDLKTKKAGEVGINVVLHKYDESITELSLISEINDLNHNPEITGIMVQLPLPARFSTDNILNTIASDKDVDGLTSINLGNAFSISSKHFLSATACAIDELLKGYNIDVRGKDVTILGTSIEVGLPTTACLFRQGATVQMCNLETKNIIDKSKNADILICATGRPGLVTKEYVKEGAVVIDVGYTPVGDKVMGDVDFESVKEVASYISPVPGGVGPLTVVSLLKNTYIAFKQQSDV